MNTKTKKTLLIGTIIILIVINLSALSTIYYKNKIQPQQQNRMINMNDEIRIKGMHRFIKEELNLTENQFEVFQNASRNNMIKSQEILSKLDDKRVEMMNEIGKRNPDSEILDKIAHDIGDLHYELKRLTINHFLQLKEICNDDQQENLHRIFMQISHDQDKNDNRMDRGSRGKRLNRNGRSGKNQVRVK